MEKKVPGRRIGSFLSGLDGSGDTDWIGIRWIDRGEESAVGTGWGPGIHSDWTGIRLEFAGSAYAGSNQYVWIGVGCPGLGNAGLGCSGLRTWWTEDAVD